MISTLSGPQSLTCMCGCVRQVRQVATMADPARAKALKEREEEERIRERETLERKQVCARTSRQCWHSSFVLRSLHKAIQAAVVVRKHDRAHLSKNT